MLMWWSWPVTAAAVVAADDSPPWNTCSRSRVAIGARSCSSSSSRLASVPRGTTNAMPETAPTVSEWQHS